MSLLQWLVYGGDFDVISLCETWFNPTVLGTEILPGYNIFRRDRDDRGGGVLIAVKSTIHASRRIDLEQGKELSWLWWNLETDMTSLYCSTASIILTNRLSHYLS